MIPCIASPGDLLSEQKFSESSCQRQATGGTVRGGRVPRVIRALIVEDEHKVAAALQECFEAEGYRVAVEHSGGGGSHRLKTEPFDVVLLDLTLPGMSGLELLSAIRERGLSTPVLIVTAHDSVSDRVAGLDNGADDYLAKPFALEEVSARVRALLRRGRPNEAMQI